MMGELTVLAMAGLQKSGWFAGRRVSIDSSLRAWRDIDRSPGSEAVEAVREFFSLKVRHPHHWSKEAEDLTEIDPVGAVARTYIPVLVNEYEPAAGQKLTPIGLMGGGILIFLGEDGAVYGGSSPYLGRYGNSLQEFWNLLYSGRRPVVIKT
ncbi:SUKH-3 domain-containing protein [Kitasatospora sp. NPDC058444]|uniref:SUKH-3 domain-containing protein n=1 Tax=Kitasatospora sp. NPDC058444 TaxID=3346504 RepID=UPI00364EBF1A